MTLSEIRQQVADESGRLDLINPDGSDNGLDHFIRRACKFLDFTVDSDEQFGWYVTKVHQGDIILPISTILRYPQQAFIYTPDGRSEISVARNMSSILSAMAGDIELSVPTTCAVVGAGIAPKIASLMDDIFERAMQGDKIGDSFMEDWSATRITYSKGVDEGEQVGILENEGKQTEPYYVYPSMQISIPSNHPVLVEFWARFDHNNLDTISESCTRGVKEVSKPTPSDQYQYYAFVANPVYDYNMGSMTFTLFPFGYSNTDEAIVGAKMYVKEVNVRPMRINLPFNRYTGKFAKGTIDKRNLLLYPPSNGDYKIEIYGRMFSEPLIYDDDENFWSVNHPELLVLASCYALEASLRNTQGMQDWLAAMKPYIEGIEKDSVERNLNVVDKMEG